MWRFGYLTIFIGLVVGCSSTDSTSSGNVSLQDTDACATLEQYAYRGIPATYLDDGAALFEILASRFVELGRSDIADSISEIVRLTYQGPGGQLTAKSQLVDLARFNCRPPNDAGGYTDSGSNEATSGEDNYETNTSESNLYTPEDVEPIPASCGTYVRREGFPVTFCQQGVVVSEIQSILYSMGYGVDVDGYYGPGTAEAIASYQRQTGLAVTGVVDYLTYSYLTGSPGLTPGSEDTLPSITTSTSLSPQEMLDLATSEFYAVMDDFDGVVNHEIFQACDEIYAIMLRTAYAESYEWDPFQKYWRMIASIDFPGPVLSIERVDVIGDDNPEFLVRWDIPSDSLDIQYGSILGSERGCSWGRIPTFFIGRSGSYGVPNIGVDGEKLTGIDEEGNALSFEYDPQSRVFREVSLNG